ncbi:hypothetical protein BO83DRAFT_375698, partial [Aspergillus eucalypticola CBS 122712]
MELFDLTFLMQIFVNAILIMLLVYLFARLFVRSGAAGWLQPGRLDDSRSAISHMIQVRLY